MKATLSCTDLKENLLANQGAVSTKGIVEAFGKIKIVFCKDQKAKLILQTSNGDISEYGNITLSDIDNWEQDTYEILLPAEKFIKLVQTFDRKNITFEIGENTVLVKAGKAIADFTRESEELSWLDSFELDTQNIRGSKEWIDITIDWVEILNKVAFAQNDADEESKGMSLTGVQIDISPVDGKRAKLQIRATNRSSVAHIQGLIEAESPVDREIHIYLKKEVVSELLARSTTTISFEKDGTQILAAGKASTFLHWAAGSHKFPDLDRPVRSAKEDEGIEITFNRETLVKTLARATLLVDPMGEFRYVTMTITPEGQKEKIINLKGDGNNVKFKEDTDVMEIKGLDGKREIIFDPDDVNEYVKVSNKSQITLKIVENFMVVLTEDETILPEESYVYLVALTG